MRDIKGCFNYSYIFILNLLRKMNYSPKGKIFVSEREQCALSQVNINTGTHVLLKAQSIHCSISIQTLFLNYF